VWRWHPAGGHTIPSPLTTQTGYATGGGLEYAFLPARSFKAEYQYVDLGHDNATGPAGYVRTRDQELNTVRGGINYHVGPSYEPLK
jgi:outer membrane immunogenic protein